jgi:hypothetical protein
MGRAQAFPPGGNLDRRQYSFAGVAQMDDPRDPVEHGVRAGGDPPDPLRDEPKYAAWKVTLFVILFCGAFWAGLSYLAMRLFG